VITKVNYRLLQILDVVQLVCDIPATTADEACRRLIWIFKELSSDEQTKIAKLALKYTDYVRALCGRYFGSQRCRQVAKRRHYIQIGNFGKHFADKREMEDNMNLHENKNLFVSVIKCLAENTDIQEVYIEKDYWLTRALRRLSQNS
jgi:hypothetical protein